MLLSAALFALMGACVKSASAQYAPGELVLYRSLVGICLMVALLRRRGDTLRTTVPWMHAWRAGLGVGSLCLWFTAIGGLPLGTAMTLNSTSSIWLGLFALGGLGALRVAGQRVDPRLLAAVAMGFVGVLLILRPTFDAQQWGYGLAGLLSGIGSALAYLKVAELGRHGEPEERIVFYFSLGGVAAGLLLTLAGAGPTAHTPRGVVLLLAIGLLATTAQLMMTRAYAIGHTLVNAVLQYLGIAFSVGLGLWLFDDPLETQTLLGIALVVGAGLAATRLQAHRTSRAPPARDCGRP